MMTVSSRGVKSVVRWAAARDGESVLRDHEKYEH